MISTSTKVERTKKFATFTMDNGIAVAVSLIPTENRRNWFEFITSNMRKGKLIVSESEDFLCDDEELVRRTTEYFNKYMIFKPGTISNSINDKIQWFLDARLPLITKKKVDEIYLDCLCYCLSHIQYKKDIYNQKLFSLEDIDNCIKEFRAGYNNKRKSEVKN
ncbi:hypothetical protein [Priestia aryabhattai]